MQLKAYIQEPNTDLRLDNSYRAVAVCKETLEGLLEERTENMPIKLVHVFGVCPFIALGLIWLIIIIMLTLYGCTGRLENRPHLNRQRKSVILSIALISTSRLVYCIVMDGFAIHFRKSTLQSDLKNIFFDGKFGDYHHLLYRVPDILLGFDVISLAVLVILVIIAVILKNDIHVHCVHLYQRIRGYESVPGSNQPINGESEQADAGGNTWNENRHYYFLGLTSLCLLFSILLHSPYIITAYLNDAQHAGSIFIFYTTLTLIEFGLLQFSFNRSLESHNDLCGNAVRKYMTMTCGIISAVLIPLLLYGLTVVIMLYFYFVPTDDSISSIPNQMVVSYQTAILFVGAYIAYASIFKKKSSLQTALRDTHPTWNSLTDQEVLTEFYREMITRYCQ